MKRLALILTMIALPALADNGKGLPHPIRPAAPTPAPTQNAPEPPATNPPPATTQNPAPAPTPASPVANPNATITMTMGELQALIRKALADQQAEGIMQKLQNQLRAAEPEKK